MNSKEHWEQVYATKPATGVSWYQEHAGRSLRLIQCTGGGVGQHPPVVRR